jgi:cell fate (sporulation/competence/biofilm development) regulator YmcA (YheA/YmcA/DUF963 family)
MNSAELEAKVRSLAETVDQLKSEIKAKNEFEAKLEARLRRVEDTEAIKKLQRAYCYYLEHWQEEEIISLWSHSSEVSVELNETGLYQGWEAVKKSFSFPIHYTAFNGEKTAPPEFLHLIMPLAGIVDVDPDSKTAKARWYSLFHGALYRGGKLRAIIGAGIWENEYIKEDGIWKFKKLFFNNIFSSPYEDGWVKTPYIPNPPNQDRPAPGPNTHFATYPSGYIFPYHYKNPVTGK